MLKNEMLYTDGELMLLKIIQSKRGINSDELTEKYYKNLKKEPPLYARQSCVAMIRAVKTKLRRNKETITISTGGRQGPNPSKYWIEGVK